MTKPIDQRMHEKVLTALGEQKIQILRLELEVETLREELATLKTAPPPPDTVN